MQSIPTAADEAACNLCGGAGFTILESADGRRSVRDCACRLERKRRRIELKAGIPPRYAKATLENFCTDGEFEPFLFRAQSTCKKFVESYPLETKGIGLLLTGQPGIGKTHLAIGLLKGLLNRGATGIFCHYHELIKQVQNSYNNNVQATELDILRPIFEAEILVLDEVGASRPTDWVFDTISHILNTRYNERRTTILTTNFSNAPAVLSSESVMTSFVQAREALRDETLGDRIGERMRSRLQEMCVVVEMRGADYRQSEKLARLG